MKGVGSMAKDQMKTIRQQVLAIRKTGETNMFDVPVVQRIALREGYYELVEFLVDHSKEYWHFIFTGTFEG